MSSSAFHADGRCRDHDLDFCRQCVQNFGQRYTYNPNASNHTILAQYLAETTPSLWGGGAETIFPARDLTTHRIWIKWLDATQFSRKTYAADVKLADILFHHRAQRLQVECFDNHGVLYMITPVDFDWTLGQLVDLIGADHNLYLILQRDPRMGDIDQRHSWPPASYPELIGNSVGGSASPWYY